MATLYRLANLKLETLKPCQRNQIFKQILRAKTKQKLETKCVLNLVAFYAGLILRGSLFRAGTPTYQKCST